MRKNISDITSVQFIETKGPSIAIGTKSKRSFLHDLKLLGVGRVITLLSGFDQPDSEEEKCRELGLNWVPVITEPFYDNDDRKTEQYEQSISTALRNTKIGDRLYVHIANGNTESSKFDFLNTFLCRLGLTEGEARRVIEAHVPGAETDQDREAQNRVRELTGMINTGEWEKIYHLLCKDTYPVRPLRKLFYKMIIEAPYEGNVWIAPITRRLLELGLDKNGAFYDRDLLSSQLLPWIFLAALYNEANVVRVLSEAGANVDVRSEQGETPLLRAAWQNNFEIVKILLQAGADSNAQEKPNPCYVKDDPILEEGGKSVLMAAVNNDFGNTEMVRFLIENGADPAYRTPYEKRTILSEYVMNRFNSAVEEMIPLLIDAGIDPNDRDASGYTALMLSARYAHARVVEPLITHGADPYLKTEAGETAFTIAGVNDDEEQQIYRNELRKAVFRIT